MGKLDGQLIIKAFGLCTDGLGWPSWRGIYRASILENDFYFPY
jgi:hypothetical protein